MTTLHATTDFGRGTALASRVTWLLRKSWDGLKERRKRARVRAVLYGMEGRELKDLGFTRDEIDSVGTPSGSVAGQFSDTVKLFRASIMDALAGCAHARTVAAEYEELQRLGIRPEQLARWLSKKL